MENSKLTMYSTSLLAFTAGFADAGTYTAANKLFSAHVTGNFVVFAYKLASEPKLSDFLGLISFPVFIAAVYFTGRANKSLKSERQLSILIGVLLCAAALVTYCIDQKIIISGFIQQAMLMMIVFAMGIQNALNKIYTKSIYGPTTVMTGNVTKATLDLCGYFGKDNPEEKMLSLKGSAVLIVGFLIGCLLGAVLSHHYGLVSMSIPGGLIIAYYSFYFIENQ